MVDTQGDSLLETAIAQLYQERIIQRHIKKSLKVYKERRDHFCGLLHQKLGDLVSFEVPDGGISVWCRFPKTTLDDLPLKASQKGLTIKNGREYDSGQKKYNAIRMGFASLDLEEQKKAIDILAESVL